MRIIISPAKKMNEDVDFIIGHGDRLFREETSQIAAWMKGLTYDEAKRLWKCSDALARVNYERLRGLDPDRGRTPAVLAYEGIQYQYMAPSVFSDAAWDYAQEHLRILSGFYGVLRPLDGVTPYRLEMQAKARVNGARDLYDFWGKKIGLAVTAEDPVVLNLASKEYAKCVEKVRDPAVRFITCIFGELRDGSVLQKGTQAKMARGAMVRFLAEEQVECAEGAKGFRELGYRFREDLSSDTEWVFIRG